MTTRLSIGITPHAVERYCERLHKDHLTSAQARQEIEALMQYGQETSTTPDWLNEAQMNAYGKHHCYIVTDSLAFPARRLANDRLLLLSCITRGSLSPERRKARNKYKHIKRSKRGAGLRRRQGR